MNDFDKAARRAVKDAPAHHIAWVFPNLAGALVFDDWLDAQSAPRPGEADRRCDTIARLKHPEKLGPPWAAVLELFADPDPAALDRTAKYVWTYRDELRFHGDKYRMAASVVFLTAAPGTLGVEDELPGGDSCFVARPKPVVVSAQDALATMAAIRENRLGPGILPWVPLMLQGQTTDAAKQWERTALEKEPDVFRQREMAGLAWVFTELTKCRDKWRTLLEGFGMVESIAWREVRVAARQEDLTRLLKGRFKEALPPSLLDKVKKEERPEVLLKWFDAAIDGDLPTIQQAMGE